MSLVQKLAKQIAFFFFKLNFVTGEILSQGESVPEPSLGRGKFLQHVRNETDVPLRKNKCAKGKSKGKRGTRIQTEL